AGHLAARAVHATRLGPHRELGLFGHSCLSPTTIAGIPPANRKPAHRCVASRRAPMAIIAAPGRLPPFGRAAQIRLTEAARPASGRILALAAASDRRRAPSLAKMLCTWFFTVLTSI